PFEMANIPGLQVHAMTLVDRAKDPNHCIRTRSPSALRCLRNQRRREQSPDENSYASNPDPAIHDLSSSQRCFCPQPTGGGNPSEVGRAICDMNTSKCASRIVHPCEMFQRGGIVAKSMAAMHKNSDPGLHNSGRRIVVVAVPPVDELDLVGPLQVFNSVNRLVGRTIYSVEVVTSADRLTIDGEGGVLTFVARHHFKKVAGPCDSVLLVCGLGSRSTRDKL